MNKTSMIKLLSAVALIAAGNTFAADSSSQSTMGEIKQDAKSTAHKTGRFVEDSAITASVKTKLIADKMTKAHNIKVVTKNGVVQLTGTVDSDAELKQAETIAQSVDGVHSVKNDLKTK